MKLIVNSVYLKAAVALLFCAVGVSSVAAEKIIMKNGVVLEAAIIKQNDETVVISMSGAEMDIPRAEIEKIEANETPANVAAVANSRVMTDEEFDEFIPAFAGRLGDIGAIPDRREAAILTYEAMWKSEEMLLPRALTLLKEDRLEPEQARFEREVESHEPDDVDHQVASLVLSTLHTAKALDAMERLREDEARVHLKDAKEAQPMALRPRMELARMAKARARWATIIDELEDPAVNAPDLLYANTEASLMLGRALLETGNYAVNAIQVIEGAAQAANDPGEVEAFVKKHEEEMITAYLDASAILSGRGDKQRAFKYAKEAIALKGDDVDREFAGKVAIIMKKLGDQKQAEKWGVRAGFMQRQTPQGYGNSSSKRFQRASEGSLSHAVSRARKENKKVLLYVGAEWCPPCKQFKAKVLPRKETREFIADNFIYVQLDGEKGEGPSVAKMIGLRAYPTFAVLDGKGNVLFKQSGAPTTPSGLKNMLSRFI